VLIGHFGQVGVAKVGCARNDKTECRTGNKAFLIHSEFDFQSSQPFCDHVLYIYKVYLAGVFAIEQVF
jgi:hypothetical protein